MEDNFFEKITDKDVKDIIISSVLKAPIKTGKIVNDGRLQVTMEELKELISKVVFEVGRYHQNLGK